jgi:hypothetical protein
MYNNKGERNHQAERFWLGGIILGRELNDIPLDEVAMAVPVGEIRFKEVAVKNLPLYIVITTQVIDVDLPKKEFLSTGEFEDYLHKYAEWKYEKPADREKFIKKHLNNALYLDDEIRGDHAWQFNEEVNFENARKCGFGILKTQSKQFYMFQTNLGVHLPSQFAAYQALTYGMVERKYLPLFGSRDDRNHLKQMIGDEVYPLVLEALGLKQQTDQTLVSS